MLSATTGKQMLRPVWPDVGSVGAVVLLLLVPAAPQGAGAAGTNGFPRAPIALTL